MFDFRNSVRNCFKLTRSLNVLNELGLIRTIERSPFRSDWIISIGLINIDAVISIGV